MRLLKTSALLLIFCAVAPDTYGQNQDLKLPLSGRRGEAAPGYYQKKAVRGMKDNSITAEDSLKMLVIRVSFPDRDFMLYPDAYPPHDSMYFENELSHLKEYYMGASLERFELITELYDGVVEVSQPEGYYGVSGQNWNLRMAEMFMEVVDFTDSTIDFSEYGTFALIHAGAGRETDIFGDSPGQIWSGFVDPEETREALADTLGTPGIPTNDEKGGNTFYIDNFLILPETSSQDGMVFGSLGIYAFQLGKRLGMLPLYDSTPSDFSDSQGIGNFGLMSYGLYNALGIVPAFPCGFNRYLMGWVDPVVIEAEGQVELMGINQPAPDGVRMARIDIGTSEYFLLVNREHDINYNGIFDFEDLNEDGIPQNNESLLGAEFDFFLTQETNPYSIGEDGRRRYITGNGLLIWHVDETVIAEAVLRDDLPNDNSSMKGVDLEEADGVQDMDRPGGTYSFGSNYDAFREDNRDSFGVNTLPSSEGNSGVRTGIEITDISPADTVMSFYYSCSLPLCRSVYSFSGTVDGINPVSAESVAGEDVVMLADSGLIYHFRNAGGDDWRDRISLIADFGGIDWRGGAVTGNVDGISQSVFGVSYSGAVCSARFSGEPFPLDTDETPGRLDLPDSLVSLPLMLEADGDVYPEVLVISSGSDSIYFNLIGASGFGESTLLGNGVLRSGKAIEGALFSSPSVGEVKSGGNVLSGVFFLVCASGGGINADFWSISADGPERVCSRRISDSRRVNTTLADPSSGDLDGDGSDEMVVSLPGDGLIFWNPARNTVKKYVTTDRLSPVALADINGDGIPETAARGGNSLYLFSGEGLLEDNWPAEVLNYEPGKGTGNRSQPLIVDIDGDGLNEIIADFSGGIYAFEADGRPVKGWPIPGAGNQTPLFFEGEGDSLFMFTAGTEMPFSGSGENSRAVRYTIDEVAASPGWYMYRRDPRGSARGVYHEGAGPVEANTGSSTMICYPNPAAGNRVYVRARLEGPADLVITVFNMEGEKLLEEADHHHYSEGSSIPYEKCLMIDDLSGGVYICCLEVSSSEGSWREIRKFAVVR